MPLNKLITPVTNKKLNDTGYTGVKAVQGANGTWITGLKAYAKQGLTAERDESAYRSNLAKVRPEKWYSGDQPTGREILGRIGQIGQTNSDKAMGLYSDFKTLQDDPTSRYYNPYTRATNRAVSNLAALGIDTSNVDDEWFEKNSWLKNYYTFGGTTNNPTKPGKKASAEELAAYEYYQLYNSKDATDKAATQWQALQDEVSYWARRTDRNYSDEEILSKINWNNYSALTAMDEGREKGTPVELNRAIGYSRDNLYGVIWAARNGGSSGSMESDVANSVINNNYQRDRNIADKLDPKSPSYNPYALGSTLEDEGLYFNKQSFEPNWTAQNRQKASSNDRTEASAFNRVDAAEGKTKTIEEQTGKLDAKLEEKLNGETDATKVLKWLDTQLNKESYAALKELDDSLHTGKLIDTTRALKFNLNDYRNYIIDTCQANSQKEDEDTTLEQMNSEIGKPVQASAPGAAGDLSVSPTRTKEDIRDEAAGYLGNTAGIYSPKDLTEAYDAVHGQGSYASDMATAPSVTELDFESPAQQETETPTVPDTSGAIGTKASGSVYTAPTAEQKKITEERNKNVKDGFDIIDEDATEAEAAVRDTASSVTYEDTKNWFSRTFDRILDARDQYATRLIKNSAGETSSAVLQYSDLIAEYEQNEDKLQQLTNRQRELEEIIPSQEAMEPLQDVMTYTMDVNGEQVEVTLEYNGFDGYDTVGVFRADGSSAMDLYNGKLKEEINQKKQDLSRRRAEGGTTLTEEQEAAIQEHSQIAEQINALSAQQQENAAAYNHGMLMTNKADFVKRATIGLLQRVGADTKDLEYTTAVTDFFMGFTQYDPTNWQSYSAYNDYAIEAGISSSPDTLKRIYQEAGEADAEVAEALEAARWSLDYADRMGIKLPDNVRSNLERYISKLENTHQEYDYFSYTTRDDFKEQAADGRERFDHLSEFDHDAYAEVGLEGLPLWNMLTDDQKQELEYWDKQYTAGLAPVQQIENAYENAVMDASLNGGRFGFLGFQNIEDLLTGYEQDTYYYLLNAEGIQAAQDYYDFLTDPDTGILQKRSTDEFAAQAEDMVNSGAGGAIMSNLVSVLLAPVAAVSGTVYAIQTGLRKMAGDDTAEFNPYNVALATNIFRNSTMEASAEAINTEFADNPFARTIAQGGLEIFRNRGDSIMNAATFGTIFPFLGNIGNDMLKEFMSALPMGLSAGVDAAAEAKKKGATDVQAYAIAGATVLAETATEAISLENIGEAFNIGGEIDIKTVRDFLKNWVTKAGISEAFGETVNDWVENTADSLIMGENSDRARLIAQYQADGMTPEEAEAAALRDEMAGYLHTALISFITPGVDIVSYAAGKFSGYKAETRNLQQAGLNVNVLDVMRMDKEARRRAEAGETAARAENTGMSGAQEAPAGIPEGTIREAPQAQSPTGEATAELNVNRQEDTGLSGPQEAPAGTSGAPAPAQGQSTAAPVLTAEEQAQKAMDERITQEWEILETASGNVTNSTRTAAVAAVLDTGVSPEASDTANAAAQRLGNLFRTVFGEVSNVAKNLQDMILFSRAADIDPALTKQAVTNAALGGEKSEAYRVMTSEGFQTADGIQQVQMLTASLRPDAMNSELAQEIQKTVHEARVAEKVKQLAADGALAGAREAQAAVDKAAEATTQAKNDLQEREAEVEAAGEAVLVAGDEMMKAVDSGDESRIAEAANQMAHVTSEKGKALESREQYDQHLKNTQAAQEEAERKAKQARGEAMMNVRQQAETLVAQEDQQRAEAAALAAEEARVRAEEEAEAKVEADENESIAQMDMEAFIDRVAPDATPEERERVRQMMLEEQQGMQAENQQKDLQEQLKDKKLSDLTSEEVDELIKEQQKSWKGRKEIERRDKFVKQVSKKFNVDVKFIDTTKGDKVAYQEGYQITGTNTIVLDNRMKLDDVVYRVFVHELTHMAEQSETYSDLAKALVRMKYGDNGDMYAADVAAKKAHYDRALAEMHKQDESISGDPISVGDASKEIVADLMGNLIKGDRDLIYRFATEEPSVARRFLDSLKTLLKRAIGMKGAWYDQTQRTVDMLETALRDVDSLKTFIDESGKKFKLPDTTPGLAEQIMSVSEQLNDMNPVKSISSKIDLSKYDEIAHSRKAAIKLWAEDMADSLGRTVNRDGFGTVELNNKAISRIFSYLGYNNDAAIAAFEALPEVIRYGIEAESHLNHKGRDVDSYTFAAPIEVDNTRGNMGVILRKSRHGNKFKTYKVLLPDGRELVINNEKTELAHQPSSEEVDHTDSVFAISVSQEEAPVKSLVQDNDGNSMADEFRGGTVSVNPEIRYSLNSFNEKEQNRTRQALLDVQDDNGNRIYTPEQVDKYMGDALGIASMIAADKTRLDFQASDNQVFLKQNNDYYFTLDASTLCAKRLLYQGTFDYVQHALPDEVFTPTDLIDLVNIMNDMGYETPCGICYVESRRRWLDTYAQQFLDTLPEEGRPSIDDLTTSDGLEKLRNENHDMYQAFVDAMNAKGSANPKVVQLRTEYRGDIDELSDRDIQKVKDIGGLRIQSFSDFETPHLLDMVQAVMDMSARRLTSQAYTKVPNFAWVFGDTGIKINLSLIGKGTGLDENGNLVFDNKEGMNFDEAMQLRNRYSKNVGTILVGINDEHIIAAMGDPRIDFIIPFHKSGWSQEELRKMPTLNSYNDYTDSQNERIIIDKKTVTAKKNVGQKAVNNWVAANAEAHPNYTVTQGEDGKFTITYVEGYVTESFQKHQERTKEKLANFEPVGAHAYWEFDKSGEWNARKYLQMCKDQNRIPKFSQFLVDNGDGSFSLPEGNDKRSKAIREGYWKTLIDFKMYDNDGNGAAQQEVAPNINMVQAERVLNEHQLGRQMPNRADGTPGRFIPVESNNDVPIAIPAAERYIELIKERRRGVKKPTPPNKPLEAVPSIDVASLPRNTFDQTGYGVAAAANAFGASQAPAVMGNTPTEYQEANATRQNAMAIDAETGETVRERRFSLPSDRPYLTAVEHGDLDSAQKMVDQKAQQAGYNTNYLVWRGDADAYNELLTGRDQGIEYDDPDNSGNLGNGLYFTPNRSYAERFSKDGVLRKFYLKYDAADLNDADVIAEMNRIAEEITDEDGYMSSDELFDELLSRLDKNAIIGHNVGGFAYGADEIAVQESWQAKLADPVTYDNDGNVIPLSERFNDQKDDIRYSLPSDAPYLAAVERGEDDDAARMVEEYAASKGYTDKAYHGTDSFGFVEFDMGRSQDEIFVAYNPDTSRTYTTEEADVRPIWSGRDFQMKSNQELLDIANDNELLAGVEFNGSPVESVREITREETMERISTNKRKLHNMLEGASWENVTQNKRWRALGEFTPNEYKQYMLENIYAAMPKNILNSVGTTRSKFFDAWGNFDTPQELGDRLYEVVTGQPGNFLFREDAISTLFQGLLAGYRANASDAINELQSNRFLKELQDDINVLGDPSFDDGAFEIEGSYSNTTRVNRQGLIQFVTKDIFGQKTGGIYELYTRPGNQLVIDAEGNDWNEIPVPFDDSRLYRTREIAEWARENGYDSVRINDVYDHGGLSSWGDGVGYGDIGIFFNPEDVKSADAITYDDNRNVIPLSERFTDQTKDIRYSLPSDDILRQQIRQYLRDGGSLSVPETLPGRPTALPGMPTGESGNAYRQFGRQTAQRSNALHDEVKEYLWNNSRYTPDSNNEQIDRALGWVQSHANAQDTDGYYSAMQEVLRPTFDYRSADGQARMLTVMGMAALKGDIAGETRLADAYNKQGTDLGRQLQARQLFRLMTPIGRENILQGMVDEINDNYEKKGKKTRVGLSEETKQAARRARSEKDFQRVRKQAAEELAAQMPANWKEKLQGWRMLSMLGNPRTHIRNIFGNAMFMPAVGLKNKVGALAELAVSEGNRTKTLGFASKEARAFAKQDAKNMEGLLRGEAKYNDQNAVQQARKIFGQGEGLISRTFGRGVQALNDINSNALEAEDWIFLSRHYRNALGGYMTANKLTAADMTGATLDRARAYAVNEAQKATYRDANKLASKLSQLGREGGPVGFFVNAVLPFKKTPANILKRGLEYSPAGLLKALSVDAYHLKQYNDYQAGKLSGLPEKAISPTQWIDKIASGLTGSGILALGAALCKMGIVRAGFGDDEDELDKQEGEQEYSLKLHLFGHDVSYTIDWAAPTCMPFFVGATLYDVLSDDGEKDLDIGKVFDSILGITEPVFNLSMLDGINSLLDVNQYDENKAITQIGEKVVTNYVSSYVPTVAGQIARTIDTTRRKNYVESGASMSRFRYALEQVENKIPFLSKTNIPYRNVWGEADVSPRGWAAVENFLSPGYGQEIVRDDVTEELRRLYRETGKTAMIPKMPSKTLTVNRETLKLDAEQYDLLTVERGQTAKQALTDLMVSDEYQMADDLTRSEMIGDVWTYANQTANTKIDSHASKDKWVGAAEKAGNLTDTIIDRAIERNKNEYINGHKKSMLDALDDGDIETAQVSIEALRDVGKKDSSIKTYITNYFKPIWQEAIDDGDFNKADDIELTLDDLDDFSFDYAKWEVTDDEEETEIDTSWLRKR